MFLVPLLAVVIWLAILIKCLNGKYFILAGCKRVKSSDGTPLVNKLCLIPGKSIFGNNLDFIHMDSEKLFAFCRENCTYADHNSYLLYFLWAPMYCVTKAEDAEEVLQNQTLLTKSILYDLIRPFMGEGLLTSTDQKWHSRRKLLTPAFHFNILQTFLEVFKEESYKFINTLQARMNETIELIEFIPEFTLNNVCETALGVKLDDIRGSREYRHTIHRIELLIVNRICNPLMYIKPIFYFFGDYKQHMQDLKEAHDFSSRIIEKKRQEFISRTLCEKHEKSKEFGKKKRYAMLDTLLDAEADGLIDHRGICEEVDTFMFEGYDTTSTCLMMTILNLGVYQDIQEKCYQEVTKLANLHDLTVFDFNKLEYMECCIKETLRLYPSVPFVGRQCTSETKINSLVLPKGTQISIHVFDLMRDPRHFPEPLKFDPDRFLPENTTNRHPFAFVPFSAGPRNCIGQKFAILEMKVLLVSILRNFKIFAVTRIEDINFQYGFVLRTKQNIQIKLVQRDSIVA